MFTDCSMTIRSVIRFSVPGASNAALGLPPNLHTSTRTGKNESSDWRSMFASRSIWIESKSFLTLPRDLETRAVAVEIQRTAEPVRHIGQVHHRGRDVRLFNPLDDLQQSFERLARALHFIAVRPPLVRFERHCAAVVFLVQRRELALEIDITAADRHPRPLSGLRAGPGILNMHVRECSLAGFLAIGKGSLTEKRRVARIPDAAQIRRIDVLDHLPEFLAGSDVAGIL